MAVRAHVAMKAGVTRARVASATLFAAGAAMPAMAGDLVYHDGFEVCWAHAITESQFLTAMRSAIDGVESCVPEQDLLGLATACNTMACSGGTVVGCPVKSHANPFTGTFAIGTSEFSAPGSADDIVVPTSVGCSITISNIGLTYTLDYTMQVDGNNGLYAASLDKSAVAVGAGYLAGGSGGICQTFILSLGPLLVTQIESAAGTGVQALETAATVGESVCPLTP